MDSASSATPDGDETAAEEARPTAVKRFAAQMTAIFTPILPPLIGAGILQGLLSILTGFGLLSADSSEYYVLNAIGSAIFFFLPFLLAVSSAQAFHTNIYVAVGLAALLLHPDISAIMSSPQPMHFVGIPISQTQYTSSVLPIILVIWLMSHLARLFKRVLPSLLHTILVPTLVMLTAGLLSLLIVGPLGNIVATALESVVGWLSGEAPWLVPTLIGSVGALLISVGASFALFPLALASVASLGYNTVYGPGMLAVNFSLAGVSLAAMHLSKEKTYRAYSASAALTAVMGVAQPALYGVAIPLGRPLVATCIGGMAGGLVGGLSGFKVYGFLPSGVAAVPAMVGPDGVGNLLWGVAVMVVALGSGYLATRVLGFDEPTTDTVASIVGDTVEAGPMGGNRSYPADDGEVVPAAVGSTTPEGGQDRAR